MSITYILGGSGSGKSYTLYEKITQEAQAHPNRNYLVIVPDQFTLATQKKLVDCSPNHAIMNVDVLSFKRLAYRVFDDLGMSDLQVLEETGKNLVLRRIAQEQDEKLTVLKHNMSRIGYIDEMKSLISEFVQYNVTPDRLKELLKQDHISGNLAKKLEDVVLLYEQFQAYMKDNYLMAEEILNLLKSVAGKSQLLRGSVIVFDEFTGFTPIQYELIREILPLVNSMWLTLTIDINENTEAHLAQMEADKNGKTDITDLFALSKTTIYRLEKIVDQLNCGKSRYIKLEEGRRFKESDDLAFLEKNIFRPVLDSECVYSEKPQHIRMINATNPKEEILFCAREINRLVRTGRYRYQNIAVISGAVDSYGYYVAPIFERYHIPYFLDSTKKISFSPFIEFVRAILEIYESNFSYESILRMLRSGFSKLDTEDIDYLDNYLLATGIRGKNTWKKTWLGRRGKSTNFNLERVEQIRLFIVEMLEPFSKVMQSESSVSDAIYALYQVIVSQDAQQRLVELESEYLQMGLQSTSKEYCQVYEKVMSLLNKYDELMGEEIFEIHSFVELFEAGLSAIKIATVPPGYDSVVIGDVERTRLNEIQVVFFVGINDGIIPKSTDNGGIISQYERETIEKFDIELAPGARERAFTQKFYLYRNLTKPSELLYLSYARCGSDGKAIVPSYLISTIQNMFPELQKENLSNYASKPDFSSMNSALEFLAHGELSDSWYAVANILRGDEVAEKILEAPFTHYTHDPISRNVAHVLYGDALHGSITRLEQFSACAYAHFLDFGLRLKEREEAGLNSLDAGIIYHEALERFSKKMSESNAGWRGVEDSDRIRFSNEAMDEALLNLGHTEFLDGFGAETHQLERMKLIFERNTWALVAQVKRGKFTPENFEISFEGEDENTFVYSLKDGHMLNMSGRIDRIDTYTEDDKVYVKVIDYKTGSTEFDLNKLYYGLQLQLAIYLNVAIEHNKHNQQIVPAGILYHRILDPVIPEKDNMDVEHEFLKSVRPSGLVNSDSSVYLAMDENLDKDGGSSDVIPVALTTKRELAERGTHVASTEELELLSSYAVLKLLENGEKIYDGNIEKNPYEYKTRSSCDFCSYRAVCGLDGRIPGYVMRKLESRKDDEALEYIRTGEALMRNARKDS